MTASWPSRAPRLAAALLAAVLAGAPPAADAAGGQPLRRVVLISCDTLRSASLPGYGNPSTVSTVGLDSLANQGTLFLNCTTPMGWTLPAHVAMLTGQSPGAVRVGIDHAVPASVPLLAEHLSGAGFTCGGFPAVNQWLDPGFGFGRGFAQYRFQNTLAPIEQWTRGWDLGESLLAAPDRASFLLFFHFMDTHTVPVSFDHRLPYWAIRDIDRFYNHVTEPLPEPKLTSENRWDLAAYDPDLLQRAYRSTITSLDFLHLRPLLGHLRETGLDRDTMVIVTSDHGEQIGEHGGYLHDDPYAEIRNVPLIVIWPGVLPAGKVVYTPVSILDITPTILDFAGLPLPDFTQGLSLRPLLSEPAGFFPQRDFLIDGHRRGYELQASALIGLEDGTMWSLVATTDTSGCAGTFAPARVAEVLGLYDLDGDPAETVDRRGERPEIVVALRARLGKALADEARVAAALLGETTRPPARLSDDERRKLRALGY